MNRRWPLLWIIGLVVLTATVHWPSLQNGFIWDDDDHFTENPAMTSPDGLRQIWTTLAVSRYYPLTLTTFWVQQRLWGLNPMLHHAVNIVLHAASAVLIFALLRKLQVRGAWAAAAIWAVHPVMVESVAWATELKNTQSGVFFFLSLLLFLKSEERARYGWYVLALACAAAALLSKPSAVILPLVLLLCVWWKRRRIGWADLLRAVPFLALSAGMSLLTIAEQRGHIERGVQDWSLTSPERLIVAGKALWFYAVKLLWPVNLTFVYARWDNDVRSVGSWLPVLATLAIGVWLWSVRRHQWARVSLFGLGYFVIGLLPVLGFYDVYYFRYSFVADHFQYLAAVGIIALASAGVAAAVSNRTAKRVCFAGVVVALGVLSWRHAQVFYDDETL